MGAASNGVGTAHDITGLCHTARQLSDGKAWTFVDVSWLNYIFKILHNYVYILNLLFSGLSASFSDSAYDVAKPFSLDQKSLCDSAEYRA